MDMEPPDWLWERPLGREARLAAGADEEGWVTAVIRVRREHAKRRDAWLQERGLVMWEAGGLSSQEYRRIEQEEPHRILRRPPRDPAS